MGLAWGGAKRVEPNTHIVGEMICGAFGVERVQYGRDTGSLFVIGLKQQLCFGIWLVPPGENVSPPPSLGK